MTTDDRLERTLTDWLAATAEPRVPDYLDDLLARTAATRQRPAWSFPERLLPVTTFVTQRVAAPAIPWRPLALLAALALLLAATLAFVAGRERPLPAPFGPAANGAVAYSVDGDILTTDPLTDETVVVVAGPEDDRNPRWSRDGTQILFDRFLGKGNRSELYLVNPDGTGLTRAAEDSLLRVGGFELSPDGRELLALHVADGLGGISVGQVGGALRHVDLGLVIDGATWRPSGSGEILLTARKPGEAPGLYLLDGPSDSPREVLPPMPGRELGYAAWSPDGRLIAVTRWDPNVPVMTAEALVLDVEEPGVARPLPVGRAVWQVPIGWSNDGARVLLTRGYTGDVDDIVLAVAPVDGSTTGLETPRGDSIAGACCPSAEWAPDDRSILITPVDLAGRAQPQILIDASTGAATPVGWEATSAPSWQRLAP